MHFNTMPFTRKLSVILAIAGGILIIGHELELYLPDLELWIQKLGAFAPLGFIALFVVLTPVFISVDTLCFAAGLLFSLGAAQIYMTIATSGILLYNASLVYMGYTTKHLAGLVSGSARQSGVSFPLLAVGIVISLLVLYYFGTKPFSFVCSGVVDIFVRGLNFVCL